MAQKIIANYQQVGQIIMGLITTYGIYKAAVVTAIAAEKLHIETLTIAKVRIAVVEKVQAALNATMLANPYVAAATALGVLVGVLVACHDGRGKGTSRPQRDDGNRKAEAAGIQR